MAYLRRGLVTKAKNLIPSVHNQMTSRQIIVDPMHLVGDLRDVKKVLSTRIGTNIHFVLLKCGHKTMSNSVYQAFCKECRYTEEEPEVNGNTWAMA